MNPAPGTFSIIHILRGHPAFWCEVCRYPHTLDDRWKWNGSYSKPTFGPAHPGAKSSFLSYHDERPGFKWKRKTKDKWGLYSYATREQAEQTHHEKHDPEHWHVVPIPGRRVVHCHTHVTDGMLRVLPDTPGPLGGKTVPLRAWCLHEDGTYEGPVQG